jgi:hypothetical protein
MLNKLKLRDARPGEEISTNVTRKDIERAIKAVQDGEPPQQCCAGVKSFERQAGIIKAVFSRHFARIWFRRTSGVIYVLRYCYSSGSKDTEARDLVCAFDIYGTATPGMITLYPPRGVRTLAYQRNKQKIRNKLRREVRGKSDAKIAKLKQEGLYKPHGYKTGSVTITNGVASDGKGRWGLGKHDSIA